MRIAIFTDSFFPGVGGTEKAVFGLADELAKKHEVAVFCPKYDGKSEDDFAFKIFRTNNIKISGEYYGLPAFSKKFSADLKEFAPDVIHCQTVSSLTRYALSYARKNKIPAIMTVHTKFREAFGRVVKIKPVLNMMTKDIAKKAYKCEKVFTVSNDMGVELESYGYKGKYHVIRNGAMFSLPPSIENLSRQADEKYGLQGKIVFLFVGLLVKYKNIQFSLKALKEYKKYNKDFVFMIVGGGPHEDYFKNLVVELGLEENVVFTGVIKDKDHLSALYARANLFLFPSMFDNDPLTIVEAAVHNTPAITLQKTGSSERIQDGVSGFVVENDLQVFADKIVEVLQDLDTLEKIGQNASRTIPKTWKQIADEYLKHYEELVYKNKETIQKKPCS